MGDRWRPRGSSGQNCVNCGHVIGQAEESWGSQCLVFLFLFACLFYCYFSNPFLFFLQKPKLHMKKRDLKNSKPRKAMLNIILNHNLTLDLTNARNSLFKYSE